MPMGCRYNIRCLRWLYIALILLCCTGTLAMFSYLQSVVRGHPIFSKIIDRYAYGYRSYQKDDQESILEHVYHKCTNCSNSNIQGKTATEQKEQRVSRGAIKRYSSWNNSNQIMRAKEQNKIHGEPFAPEVLPKIFLLILIMTRPSSSSQRQTIRTTWANATEWDINKACSVCTVFTVGFTNISKQDNDIENEALAFGDLLRVDTKESYKNLVYKVWESFQWALLAVDPEYILKVDDDVYAHLPRLVNWLQEPRMPTRLYTGYVHYRSRVNRNPSAKHYLSRSAYNKSTFPSYANGPAYLFSGNVLGELIAASHVIPKFEIEDAYFGVLADAVGLKVLDAGHWVFNWGFDLHHTVFSWTDRALKAAGILGDAFDSQTLKNLHDRYKKMKSRETVSRDLHVNFIY